MKNTKHITAFYLETLLMIFIFIGVILILTKCLAAAENSRTQADDLSSAVYLARNVAEAAASGDGPQDIPRFLPELRNVERGDSSLSLSGDPYLVRVAWEESGGLYSYDITVERQDTGREIYSLTTAVYEGEGAA